MFLTCPYCKNNIIIPISIGGKFTKETCDECKNNVFVHHSRWRPHIYCAHQVRIDEDKKQVEIIDAEELEIFNADYAEAAEFMKSIKGAPTEAVDAREG